MLPDSLRNSLRESLGIPLRIPLYFLYVSFVFPSYFLHISLIFLLYSLHISFIFPSYFLCISFVFPSYFLHISFVIPLYFLCIPLVLPLYFLSISFMLPLYFLCICFVFPLLEWGGAEPLPRASFLRREKGGATEDSVLCVCLCVCVSVRTAKTQKMEIPRFFSFWAQNGDFSVLESQIAKKVKLCKKVSKMRFLRFRLPKVSINDKVFHSFCQVASPRAKMLKIAKLDSLGPKSKIAPFLLFLAFWSIVV